MITKYGEMDDDLLINYLKRLIGKVFKVIPLKEERSDTLLPYIQSLLRELAGSKELVDALNNDGEILSIMGTLENLLVEEDKKIIKSDIFKCIAIIKRIQSQVRGDCDE
jgi:hypothetical protein